MRASARRRPPGCRQRPGRAQGWFIRLRPCYTALQQTVPRLLLLADLRVGFFLPTVCRSGCWKPAGWSTVTMQAARERRPEPEAVTSRPVWRVQRRVGKDAVGDWLTTLLLLLADLVVGFFFGARLRQGTKKSPPKRACESLFSLLPVGRITLKVSGSADRCDRYYPMNPGVQMPFYDATQYKEPLCDGDSHCLCPMGCSGRGRFAYTALQHLRVLLSSSSWPISGSAFFLRRHRSLAEPLRHRRHGASSGEAGSLLATAP